MMTKEDVIQLLQKIEYKKGNSTNLEYYCTVDNGWCAVSEELANTLHDISEDVEYRIKPEPEYVPFAFEDADQFWLKRIKHKKNIGVAIITGYDAKCVYFNDINVTFEKLYNDYSFLDGSPCGRLK